ncbi:hypothetical protein NQ318_019244 [Aromia moschata]|uniref:Uncharacterized protein n=1 Tax=Aromia moschata TaxID=1265417 RepID=A0AAV8YXG3_9CUCU|nr:hypothetical protein NQ318_019244 [Aromia moschata]
MAEYGYKPEFQPQPTYPRGVPCSLKCCNPTNEVFKPPIYCVLPPGYSSYVQPPTTFRPIHPIDENRVKAYYWVDTHAWGGIPSTALHGGVDIDGEQIYVGRGYHEGNWLPAKVIPGRNIAYVSYEGKEYHKDTFQVLCEQRFDWVTNHGGFVPPGAVEGVGLLMEKYCISEGYTMKAPELLERFNQATVFATYLSMGRNYLLKTMKSSFSGDKKCKM